MLKTKTLVVAIAVGLLLAACGDDDGGGDSAATPSSTPTTSVATEPAVDEAASDDERAQSGDFCQLNEEIARLFGELAQNGSEQTWEEIEDVVAQMPGAAPPELEADVAAAIGYYPIARAELEAADWDVGVLDSLALEPEQAEAEENITAYLDANC